MNRTAVVLFAGDARREEAQKGLPAGFLATLHERLRRTILSFEVDLLLADELVAGGALGEKIERVFAIAFGRGYARVMVLAGDIVLPPAILRRAISARETLIGPTRDGGFYILACSAMPRIEWTSLAFRDVAAQLECAHLPVLRDVDSIEDARVVAPGLVPRMERSPGDLATPQPPQPTTRLRAPPRRG